MLSLLTHKTYANERFVNYTSVCPEAIRMILPGDLRSLIAVKSMMDRLRLVLLVGAIILTGTEVQAQTRVLVLGGSEAYQSSIEAAFSTSSVATHLQGILAGDALVSQPVTVQNTDTFQTLNIANANGRKDFTSKTLMSWYYWRDTHAATLTLLKNNWNYVVMVDDPYVASTFPEYHLEGVLRISQEVIKGGATPISVMTWSSGATPVSTFGEMAYRVGDGLGVAVAPAGYAWNNVSAELKDTGTRPTARGARRLRHGGDRLQPHLQSQRETIHLRSLRNEPG